MNKPTRSQRPETGPELQLDARQFSAAWSILKLGPMLRSLDPGQVLELLGTDPKLLSDLPRVLQKSGARVLRVEQRSDYFRFLLCRQCGPEDSKPQS